MRTRGACAHSKLSRRSIDALVATRQVAERAGHGLGIHGCGRTRYLTLRADRIRGMRIPRRAVLGCAAAALMTLFVLPPATGRDRLAAAASSCNIDGVERTVAIGDVHGAADRFVEILK